MNRPEDQAPSVAERTARGAGWIIAWRMLTRNIGLVSTLVLVRLLEPADFGLVAIATGFVTSVDALSSIGVQDALIREPRLTRELLDTGFGLSVVRSVLTAVIILMVAWPIAAFFQEPRLRIVMIALSAGMVLSGFENIGLVEFRRRIMFRQEFDLQLWSRLAGTIVTIGAALAWHSYWALIAGILTNRAVRVIQSYYISPFRPRFTLQAWRKIIGFSLWTWALTLLHQFRDRSDSLVIGRLISAKAVGVFAVGAELGTLPVTEVVEPLYRAIFSAFAVPKDGAGGQARLFLEAVGLAFLTILPAGVGISAVADPLVRLTLGTDWLAAVPVVQIMAVASTLSAFSYFGGAFLSAGGNPHVAFWVTAVSVIMRLGLLVPFVALWGLPGAGAACGLALCIDQVVMLRVVLPRLEIAVGRLLLSIWRPGFACGVMVLLLSWLELAWVPARGAGSGAMVEDLAERCSIGAIAYMAAIVLVWMVAGQPDGAERRVLDGLRLLARRIRTAVIPVAGLGPSP